MRVVLLLHPDYAFPHTLESFPMEAHFSRWLDLNRENNLVVIGNCRFQRSGKYTERIVYYPLAYNRATSIFSSFQYKMKVWMLLQKNAPDCVFFEGIHAYSFFLQKGWYSLLFHRLIRKYFLLMQQGGGILSHPAYREFVIDIPEAPFSVYDNPVENRHDQIKEKLTDGIEYFLCSAAFTDPKQLTTLLKAYSIFKQRLKTNFKLVLSGINRHDKRFTSLLSHYKYRNDVIIPRQGDVFSFSDLLSAAYAHLYPSFDLFYPCSQADCAVSRVPVIYPDEQQDTAQAAGLTFAPDDIQDLAQKMMQMYKDETGRKQILQNRYEYFQHQHQAFDFSSYLPNAHF